MGEGGLILIYLVPFYGFIAGLLLGFIISSLKENKKLYQKSGFYIALFIFILMLISATQPIRIYQSYNEPSVYVENICNLIQGCNYLRGDNLCAESDIPYPGVPLNILPNEMIYICDTSDWSNLINSKQLTKEELVNGKCPNGFDALPHPLYQGYYLKDNKIYFQDNLCGDAGKIRYDIGCGC